MRDGLSGRSGALYLKRPRFKTPALQHTSDLVVNQVDVFFEIA